MAFKDLFKRKEGGTIVGNMIRGVVNNASGGLLGNGALMLKPGQTSKDNNAVVAKGAGAAAVTFNNVTKTTGLPPTDNIISNNVKQGAIMQWIKEKWYFVVGGLVVVVGGLYLILRKKKRFGR